MTPDGHRPRNVTLPAAVAACFVVLAGCAGMGGPADADAIAERAAGAGIAPELVYVLDLDGFDLATQSVGVSGADGMSAAYVRAADGGASTVMLTTDRAGSGDACDALADAGRSTYTCVVTEGEATVRLEGSDVDAATMRQAADSVRVPTAGELDELFSDVPQPEGPVEQGDEPAPGEPVERGDLPEEGDGAPLNEVGVGG
ncbi:hypothetical protein [Puerhibacterium puerhi]|uniref:hypothetical protein n=1 Tax=Puerhibacterium puerhi TaxID=2692623 RepID=UPI001359A116|nr:hypothetical protein [Puerhibacterium puerhi]